MGIKTPENQVEDFQMLSKRKLIQVNKSMNNLKYRQKTMAFPAPQHIATEQNGKAMVNYKFQYSK